MMIKKCCTRKLKIDKFEILFMNLFIFSFSFDFYLVFELYFSFNFKFDFYFDLCPVTFFPCILKLIFTLLKLILLCFFWRGGPSPARGYIFSSGGWRNKHTFMISITWRLCFFLLVMQLIFIAKLPFTIGQALSRQEITSLESKYLWRPSAKSTS